MALPPALRWIGKPVTIAIGLLAILLALAARGCHRTALIRPDVTVRVVDASGTPVAAAHVMIAHGTLPYGGIQDWWPLETDANGTAKTTALSRDEEVQYFCMHGVPEHTYFACAGKEGQGVATLKSITSGNAVNDIARLWLIKTTGHQQ